MEALPAGHARWQAGASIGYGRNGAQCWFQTKLCGSCAPHVCSAAWVMASTQRGCPASNHHVLGPDRPDGGKTASVPARLYREGSGYAGPGLGRLDLPRRSRRIRAIRTCSLAPCNGLGSSSHIRKEATPGPSRPMPSGVGSMGVPFDHGSAAMMAAAGAIDMNRMILLPDNAGWLCHVFGISFQVIFCQHSSTLAWIIPFFSYRSCAGRASALARLSGIRSTPYPIAYW